MPPEPTCGTPLKTADGTVIGTCNLRPHHLGKCAEVCRELAGKTHTDAPEQK